MANETKPKDQKKEQKKGRLGKYLREVVSEVKKLSWPTKRELVNYTLAVLAFIALMAVIIYVCDLAFSGGLTLLGNL